MHPAAVLANQRDDYLRLYMVFIVQYFFGWGMYYLTRGTLVRHLYATSIGILIQLYMYGYETLHTVILTYGAYILMGVLKRD